MQILDWKSAFRRAMEGERDAWQYWQHSRERHAMMAEANGKAAAAWTGQDGGSPFPGMAGGYAKIAAHHAFTAYPELRAEVL